MSKNVLLDEDGFWDYSPSLDDIRKAIQNGADVREVGSKGKRHWTCLHCWARYIEYESDLKKLELLIKAGADVNAQNTYGETTLYLVLCSDFTDAQMLKAIKLLVKAGANPHLKHKDGYSVYELVEEKEDNRCKIYKYLSSLKRKR